MCKCVSRDVTLCAHTKTHSRVRVCVTAPFMNGPRCCPPLICARKTQLGQKALGESGSNEGRGPAEGAPAGEG